MTKTDLYEALFPAYYLNKIWGVLPVRFIKSGPGKYTGSLRIFDVGYSVSLFLVLVCTVFWGLDRELSDGWANSTRMKSKTAVVVTCCDISAIAILASVSILGAPLRWKSIQKIIDRLVEIDEKLGIVSAKRTRRFTIIILSISIIYLIILSIVDFYIWNDQTKITTNKYNNKGPINYLPLYFLYVSVMMMEVQIALGAYSLGRRYARLNKTLENIFKNERVNHFFSNQLTNAADFREHGQFGTVIRGYLRDEPLFRIRKISAIELMRSSATNGTAEMICDLVTVHSSLSDTALLINSAFGLPALIAVVTCLLHLIITPYFLILGFNGDNSTFFAIVQTMWCIGHVGRLLIIVQPCYAASVQAKRTSVLVSQLLSVNWEPDVRKQLEIFSLQLLHRPLEFSACGLCSLDRSLVTSIAGAVTTYLVILIQFQKDDDTKETNTILKNATMLLRNATSLRNTTLKLQ